MKVILLGRDGIVEREVPSGDFEPTERGLSLGTLLVPWARVFRYDVVMRQVSAPASSSDHEDAGSRAMQRVVYEDEHGDQRTIEVPFDRFESGPWSVTMVAERELLADRGELHIRRVSIPWHRIIETERILPLPDASPARPDL